MSIVTTVSAQKTELLATSSDPAVNTEISVTLGTAGSGQLFHIQSINIPLVTDSGVANRVPVILITNATDVVVLRFAVATAITATTTGGIQAIAVANSATDADNYEIIPIPSDLIIPAGWKIKTLTAAIEAGDDYGPAQIFGRKMKEF